MNIYVTIAFCKEGQGGNLAGVVLNGEPLSREQMQRIATGLAYSETVFILPSDKADYLLLYFTPVEEVELCGHATIAAFHTLWALKQVEPGEYSMESKAGILRIQILEDGMIFMEQKRPVFYECLGEEELMSVWGEIANGDTVRAYLKAKTYINPNYPVQIVSTGLKDILLPVSSREALFQMHPNLEAIANLSREKDVVGIHAFAFGEDGMVYCRNFAPRYGIDEESATGTSSCALACYLFRYGWKRGQYQFEQGHNLGQESRILVQLAYKENEITAVYVGGYGVIVDKKEEK